MASPSEDNPDERDALLDTLEYQRASVLSILSGLDEASWHVSVVPSGWTAAGLVEHLGGAERHWFQEVVNGFEIDLPWDEGLPPYDRDAPMICNRPSADIVAYYRDQCRRSNEVINVTALAARPKGSHGDASWDEALNLRLIMLHMIEETAAHSGHLEIARELLDGQTRLGNR